MKRICMGLPILGVTLASAGCCSLCNPPPPAKVVYVQPGAPVVAPAAAPAAFGAPAAFPTAPPPPAFGQPGGVPGAPPPGARLVPPPPPTTVPQPQPPSITPLPGAGASSNRVETEWQAAAAKEPAGKPIIQLYAPEAIEKEKQETTEPPLPKKPSVQASFPAIPQFAVARDNIYTGLRPPLDGFDWLQQHDVRTVVHVRTGNTDDSADRTEVEKRKMQYVPFVVSPQTLTRQKAEEFIKLVRAHGKQGMFVYDEDGSLAGGLWYLYFRWGEFLDDDASQLRAGQLGLRVGAPGAQRDIWLAVQKVLSEDNR